MSALRTQWQQTNRKSLFIALAIALILGNSAYNIFNVGSAKTTEQEQSLAQLNRWKAEYEVLLPYQTEWERVLTPTKNIRDKDQLYKVLDLAKYGLSTNQEHMVSDKDVAITPNNTPINARRACLKTGGDHGFAITAPHFSPDLLDGLENLAKRRDIEIQNIQLTTENDTPKAIVDFCLVVRT